MVIVRKEARVIQQIYKMYLEEDLGLDPICRILWQQGVRTKRSYLGSSRIGRILKNSIYQGTHTVNQYYTKVKGQPRIPKPVSEHITFTSPAIIDPETWNRVQVKMRAKTDVHGKRRTEPYWLRKVLKCGECGSVVSAKVQVNRRRLDGTPTSYTRRYACYWTQANRSKLETNRRTKCPTPYINADQLEDSVLQGLLHFLLHKWPTGNGGKPLTQKSTPPPDIGEFVQFSPALLDQLNQEILDAPSPVKERLIGLLVKDRITILRNPNSSIGWELGPVDFSFQPDDFRRLMDDGHLSRLGEVILWKFRAVG